MLAELKKVAAATLVELLEVASRSIHSVGYAEGLYPAQWTALRYLDRETGELPTASGLARFQGLAIGPVSRTVRTLLQKGLIRKKDEQPGGRAEHLELTQAGRSVLRRDPMRPLLETMEELDADERRLLAGVLEKVVKILMRQRVLHGRPRAGEQSLGTI